MANDTAASPPPSQTMFHMITGLWVSQAVGTAAALAVPDHLSAGARSAADVARDTGCDAGAMFRLLRALASVGVLRQDGERFALTPLGETLRSNVPGSMRDMAIAQTAPGHWRPWGELREAVRTGQRRTLSALGAEIWDHYARTPAEGAAFSGAMHNLSALVAGEVARLVDTSAAHRAVDVGGAHGTLIAALLRANTALHGVLVDLPQVAAGARAALDATGIGARCEVIGGDFFQGVPDGDLYVLKQVLHDWNDEQAAAILGHCARGLRAGGRILIVEMVIPDDGRPSPAQLMDLNMLVMLPGRERTGHEYAALLSAAGLRMERIIETHSPFQIVEARAAG
jgi:SAM-dependent methyltransferase